MLQENDYLKCMISYDNRMFNMTNKKEEYLKEEQPFLLKNPDG